MSAPSPFIFSAPRIPVRRERRAVRGRLVEVLLIGHSSDEPVVFLHGFGANPDIYYRSLLALARQGKYVVAPALPSFGKSDPLPIRQQNVQGVASHMVTLLTTHYRMGPVDMVGHSFGGGVALKVAAQHPDLVRSLILVCPVGGAGGGAPHLRDIVRGVAEGDAGHGWVVNGVQHFLPALIRHAPEVVATGISAWFSDQVSDLDVVERAGIPVRVSFASKDRLVRPGAIPARHSKNVQVLVQDGHHSWLIGEPDRFVELVVGQTLVQPPSDAAA